MRTKSCLNLGPPLQLHLERELILEGEERGNNCFVFSDDGNLVIVGNTRGEFKVYVVPPFAFLYSNEVPSLAYSYSLENPPGAITCMDISRNRWIVSGNSRGSLSVWDLHNPPRPPSTWVAHGSEVSCIDCSSDGRLMLSGSADGTVHLWNLGVEQGIELGFSGHKDMVSSVAISPNGRLGLSGGWDGMVRLWDLRTGRKLRVIKATSKFVYCVGFSPDNKKMISCCTDEIIQLWETGTGRLTNSISNAGFNARFLPDGGKLIAGGLDTFKLLHAESGQELCNLEGLGGIASDFEYIPRRGHVYGHVYDDINEHNSFGIWDISEVTKDGEAAGHESFTLDQGGAFLGPVGEPAQVLVKKALKSDFEWRKDMLTSHITAASRQYGIDPGVLSWICIIDQVEQVDAYLSLVGCNLVNKHEDALFRFSTNRAGEPYLDMDWLEFREAWEELPGLIAGEIHAKVCHVNPNWDHSGSEKAPALQLLEMERQG